MTPTADREGSPTASSSHWPPIVAVVVVVPAHNEQERIGPCVRSVRQAAEAAVRPLSGSSTAALVSRVEVIVALDRCTDETAAAVADPAVHLVHLDAACVGAARGAGIRHGMAVLGVHDPCSVLVVNTDADCVVRNSQDLWIGVSRDEAFAV